MSTENKPSQEFIDRQMAGNVESIMITEFARKNGRPPTAVELASFIKGMQPQQIISTVRSSKTGKILAANFNNDDELLRWAALLVSKYS